MGSNLKERKLLIMEKQQKEPTSTNIVYFD